MTSPLGIKNSKLFTISMLFLISTSGLAWWGLNTIKERTLISTENTLITVLNTTTEALEIWIDDQFTKTTLAANNPDLRMHVEKIIGNRYSSKSLLSHPSNVAINTIIRKKHTQSEYVIIDLKGINISSSHAFNLGEPSDIKHYRALQFEQVLKGNPTLVPPIPSENNHKNGQKEHPSAPVMYIASPIKNENQNVIAIYAEKFNPVQSLTKITSLGRTGKSGETYAFDEQARLLTSSRFEKSLFKHGFISELESSILAFKIKDPGEKLVHQVSISDQHFDKPLTLMAKSAITGNTDSNVEGYRDYRGEFVLGAWTWIPNLNIGLTTEIDKEEALSIYNTTRFIIVTILFCILLMVGIIIIFLLHMSQRERLQLETTKIKLEEEVDKRTSDLLESESQLMIAKELSEQANRSKSDFLASMSHEIRTPINGVIGMLGLLVHSPLNDDQIRKVSIAQRSAKSLLNIINDILDFSKVEAGKIEIENIDFNLELLFDDIVKTMAFSAEENDIELILDVSKLSAKMAKGDPNRLRQVITNLLSNAIKFTPKGSVTIKAATTLYKETILLSCEVIDSGIGIPDERMPYLFDSFTQVDASTTREYGGTGLGLAICKKLVNLMGGDIDVASKLGQGSTFTFSATLNNSKQTLIELPVIDLNLKNILVVDDNPVNREIFSMQLKRWGANVIEACSGADGLKICEELMDDTLHIIIIDMQMPMMDGLQFTKILRRNPDYDHIKLLMMTSVIHDQTSEDLQKVGLNGWFTKPVSSSDLHRSILAILAQSNNKRYDFVTSAYLETLTEVDESSSEVIWPKDIRILLVEDNHINQIVAEGILDNLGLSCEFANNGEEAIQQLNEASPDKPFTLLLMDCQMPVMDGYKTTQHIREGLAGEHYKLIPIIAMTANAMTGDREKCLAAGMNDYLSKPIDSDLLLKAMRNWATH